MAKWNSVSLIDIFKTLQILVFHHAVSCLFALNLMSSNFSQCKKKIIMIMFAFPQGWNTLDDPSLAFLRCQYPLRLWRNKAWTKNVLVLSAPQHVSSTACISPPFFLIPCWPTHPSTLFYPTWLTMKCLQHSDTQTVHSMPSFSPSSLYPCTVTCHFHFFLIPAFWTHFCFSRPFKANITSIPVSLMFFSW